MPGEQEGDSDKGNDGNPGKCREQSLQTTSRCLHDDLLGKYSGIRVVKLRHKVHGDVEAAVGRVT